jgi:hypothetical protein
MKSRQLANVLLKILGISVCLWGLPSFLGGILAWATSLIGPPDPPEVHTALHATLVRVISYSIGYGVQAAVGFILIAKSQKIAGWMFKNDDE